MKIFPIPPLRDRHNRLVLMIKENRLRIILAMGCMLVMAISTAATAYLIKPAIDDIFIKKNTRMLKMIPIAVIIIYMLRALGMYGQEYLMNYVGQNIIRKLRNVLYDRIQDLPLAFFHFEKTGVLMSRITNDVNIIRNMVSYSITGALRDCFTIIGLTFVIFYRDWRLAFLALLILPFAFIPIITLGRRVRRVSILCQEAMADLNVFLHETFAGSKIVKAFGMENYEKNRYRKKTSDLFEIEMSAAVARSLSPPIMELLGGFGVAFIISYGGYRVIAGVSTAGTFFSFMAAVLMLYEPLKKISRLNNRVQEGLAATDRVFDIIERESELKDDISPMIVSRTPHSVTFQHVFFRHEKEMILKDIDLDVHIGEIIAIVGMSGGGKTSLVNLIPRFYDVTAGAVLLDGVDLRKIEIASLRDQIAIVTQEPILFNDTVRNNIAYGKPTASDKEIEKAARAAYACEFINRFPNQFDTNIGELGGRLSGGEKQRLCIARALLKDTPILILDEAMSSLDSESEMLVQKALENLMRGRTTFIVTHRLSTIGYADRIIVMQHGQIIEEGTHRELFSRRGEYYKLTQMQMRDGKKK